VIILATEILDPERPVMAITIQCILFLLAAVLWRNAVGKGPLESILAAATGWLRTLVLTGHRPGPQTDDGAQVPAPSAGSRDGAGRALRDGPKGDDGQGGVTGRPGDDQDRGSPPPAPSSPAAVRS
jgi:hypothetical protein